jgi:hypothetical protein
VRLRGDLLSDGRAPARLCGGLAGAGGAMHFFAAWAASI